MEQSTVIELKLQRVEQLFHTLDPQPFRERDPDRDAEEFIVGWAREIPKGALQIRIHLPRAESESEKSANLAEAIQQYFGLRVKAASDELGDFFRIGKYTLTIGLGVLAVCTAIGSLLGAVVPSPAGRFLNEGLMILGWVANWRPIEIYLYEWLPIIRRRRLYQRLANANVEVRFA